MSSATTAIKDRYGSIAAALSQGSRSCYPLVNPPNAITRGNYSEREAFKVPGPAMEASLGCGNPNAMIEILPGQTVLDLGSGNHLGH